MELADPHIMVEDSPVTKLDECGVVASAQNEVRRGVCKEGVKQDVYQCVQELEGSILEQHDHRWKKLRKTGRYFPEIIKSGRKFLEIMYVFSILTSNYSNIGQNPRK